ncbi:MAG TPA: endonuclease VII domain-containing protein [Streptosporangiaceae bacterium]|nr:endonuclease VII domain-containing protein [Streptosporangiaceae bacterium]
MPESRPRWSKYCSPECREGEKDARWRGSAPHYNRWYNYGITPEQYEAVRAAQDGRCAICRTAEWTGKGKWPHTDHDHVTGAFRGILCGNCNTGIGMLGHDPARLRAAADYLERAMTVPA